MPSASASGAGAPSVFFTDALATSLNWAASPSYTAGRFGGNAAPVGRVSSVAPSAARRAGLEKG